MTREELGSVLEQMVADGQPKENMDRVAAHYQSTIAETEEIEENPHKNSDGSWKTVDQVEEEQFGPKKEKGSQVTDATVEPQIVSEGTESQSVDGSAESPENSYQPGVPITDGGYDYKYEVSQEGKGVYYTRKTGDNEWINATEKGGVAEVSIASEFGHAPDFNKEAYFEQQKQAKLEEERKANPKTFADMGLTKDLDGSLLKGDDRYVFNKEDQKWYTQPADGIPVMAVNQKGEEVSTEQMELINSMHNTGQASSIGVNQSEEDLNKYVNINPQLKPISNEKLAEIMSKPVANWENDLYTSMSSDKAERETMKVLNKGYDDDFDVRNLKTMVNMEESAFVVAMENNFPGVSVEQTGAGNAAKLIVPWSSKPIYIDLKPESGIGGGSNEDVYNKLKNLQEKYESEVTSGKINNSVTQLLDYSMPGDISYFEGDTVEDFNNMAKNIDIPLSITEEVNHGEGFRGYRVKVGEESEWFKTAAEAQNYLYNNIDDDSVAKIHNFELEQKASLLKKVDKHVKTTFTELKEDDVLDSYYENALNANMMFDLGESGSDAGMSVDGLAKVKSYMNEPLTETVMVQKYDGNANIATPTVKNKDNWEQEKYNTIKAEMKKTLSKEDFVIFEQYLSTGNPLGKEKILKERQRLANDSGRTHTERLLDRGDYSTAIKDAVNKTEGQLNRESASFGGKIKEMNSKFKYDIKKLNVVKENLSLTLKNSGASVNTIGEGDDAVSIVSHPDPATQKSLQAKLNKYINTSKTLGKEYEKTFNGVSGEHKTWIAQNSVELKDNKKLQEFTSKEYDLEDILREEFTAGFESMAFSIPAIFGNEGAIDRVNEINASKMNLKTALAYDDALGEGEFGEFALRTTVGQAANTIVAIGSSALGIPPVWNTAFLATTFGLGSGGQTRADLTNRKEVGKAAKGDLVELEKQYKDGNVEYEDYRSAKVSLQKTIAAGDISSSQMLGATWTAAAIEGGVMAILGTIPNSMKLVKDFSGSIDDIGRVITRGRVGLGWDIAKGFGTTVGGEVLEETIIYAGSEISNNMWLKGNLDDADFSQLDDTAVTSIIMSAPMSPPGVLYSNVAGHMATRSARADYKAVMDKAGSIENMMANVKPGDVIGMDGLKAAYIANIERLGPIQSGMETDALVLGGSGLQNLIKNNINLSQLHVEAGIKPTDSQETKDSKVEAHVESLSGEKKSSYKDRIKLANENIDKIKKGIDYGTEGTAMDYDVQQPVPPSKVGDVNGGIIYDMFGVQGVQVGKDLVKGDPGFSKLSNKEQAGRVLAEIKKRNFDSSDKRVRENKEQVEAVEKAVYDGMTFEEYKKKTGKKNKRKAAEDSEYTRRANSLQANETQAMITATKQNNDAASILGDERLKGLEILSPDNGDVDGKFTKAEIEMKVREELSDKPEEANRIIAGLRNGSTNGVIVNNKYIAVNPEAAREQMAKGNLLAGTVLSHEISHFIDDATMDDAQRVDYADKLNAHVSNEMPAIDREAIHLLQGLAEGNPAKWNNEVPFAKQTEIVKDEYTKRVQDVLQQDRNVVYKKRIQDSGQGVKNKIAGIFGRDFKINSPKAAAAWMGSYLTGFENGELGKLQARKFNNAEAKKVNEQGFRESSNLSGELNSKYGENPSKRQIGTMADTMISLKPDGTFVEAGDILQSELGTQLGGMIEAITRKLFDPIAPDARKNVSRSDFKEATLYKAHSLIKNEFTLGGMTLDKYVSFLLNERSKDTARELGIESSVEFGGGGIMTNVEDEKGLYSDNDAEDSFNIQEIADPTYSLIDNLDMSKANTEAVGAEVALNIGTQLPAIDQQVSKNKFTTPFISALKKGFGVKNGPIHEAVKNMMGKTPAEVDMYLTSPINKKAILNAMPTSWLAKNLPSAVQKSVGGTRSDMDDGQTTKLSPRWTNDWKGAKIDRWNAKDQGPYRGNTAGPQVMRRNPNILAVSNVEMRKAFVNGKTMTDLNRNGLTKLQLAMAQEIGLETFKKDLNSNGPLTEVFKQRQDLFDRVLAENYAEEIGRQMERGTVKMSDNPETELNVTRGSVIVDEANKLVKNVIVNYNKDKPFGGLQAQLEGYSPEMVEAFRAMGIFDMFNTETKKGFVKPTKSMDWLGFGDQKQAYIDNGTQSVFMKEAQARQAEVVIDMMPPQVVRVLGKEFFGMTSGRQLDAARKKKDGTQGKYVYLDDKYIKKGLQKDTKVKLPFDPLKLEMLNSGSGLMTDIQKIQNMPISVADKQILLEKLQPRIDDANANNKKFLTWYAAQNAIAMENNPDIAIGLAGQMQGATNNVKGFRAYTDLGMIKLQEGSQAPYLTKPSKKKPGGQPTSVNTGVVNRDHPDFKRAMDMTNGDVIEAGKLLRYKGEHIDPSANVMQELFASTLELADALRNNPKEYHEQIIREHSSKMDAILTNFDQSLGPVIDSKIQDNKLGSTSRLGWARNLAVSDQVKNYYNTNDGGGVGNIIKQKTARTLQVLSQKARIGNQIIDKAVQYSRSSQNPTRGITVLDFDDTLATSKSLIRFTKPDGTKGTLNAEQYAKTYQELTDLGYEWDFSEFNKVVDGKIAPLFQKALKLQGKFGPESMFILTARPAEAAPAIFTFLQANGLNIPIENITGLANSTAEAKALWIAEKVGDGYNDFYFADDAIQNVKAVDNMLEQFDVKRKVQQAKLSENPSDQFNLILEQTTGEGHQKVYSESKAQIRGADKGKWKFFVPPSAEDFKGLIYSFLGKGEQGDQQMNFFQKTLLQPFARAQRELDTARQTISTDWKGLKKSQKPVAKKLNKKMPNSDYTFDQGIRVYLWDKAGFDIPGLSKTDKAGILKAVKNDVDVIQFADTLGLISKQNDGYSKPGEFWTTESIASDLSDITNTIGKDQYLTEFKENREQIFGKWVGGKLVGPNMNKIEALYGTRFREALTDMIWRMENGSNRTFGTNRLTNKFANWVNNSVGAIMFFNSRSAVLQTLSTINFVNWGDNNAINAAKAFANQPQFWSDFGTIFNSDMLKQRRSGLRTDVSQSEIAQAAAKGGGKAKAVFSYLLKVGFTPTQIADSFAIASGGATFYRNRTNTYIKQGMSKVNAEKKAFIDFQEIAEETQQSSRPDLISQQQASPLGRLILAFQNTPMQYTRLTKKAILDLANGRGDAKQHISRILYYGAIQNIMFSALQKAMFAFAFDDDDEEDKKKQGKKTQQLVNGMIDSLLRGTGVGGAVVATVKNMILAFVEENNSDDFDESKPLIAMLNISPPIGSKARKIISAGKTWKFKKDEIIHMDKPDIDNPMWNSIGNVVSATTNIPLDRAFNKFTNLKEVADSNHEGWQRLSLFLGWNTWDVGIESEDFKQAEKEVAEIKKAETAEKRRVKNAIKAKEKAKLRKEAEARSVQCSAHIRKGKGPRCGNITENKNGKCYAHQ